MRGEHIVRKSISFNTVKISAAMLRQPFHPCTVDFIAETCHARCCESATAPSGTLITIHPREEDSIKKLGGSVVGHFLETPLGRCTFKTDLNLCSIHENGQPFGCAASPFTVNSNGTLVVRNRYRLLKCYKAEGAIPAYQAHARALVRIFGEHGAAKIAAHLDSDGGDLEIVIDPVSLSMLRENDSLKHTAGAAANSSINSVFGRPEGAGATESQTGTSIFDPVLCELAYRWFCPPDGTVIDPFAGGSVRGIVASKLGRQYVGIDLSEAQIAANREQATEICDKVPPVWIVGDGKDVATLAPGPFDLLFSCPPYADLERYSEDPRDLSTMDYPAFLIAYRAIITACCKLLKNDRFAMVVVGDIRDRKGFYRGFIADTQQAFRDAGLMLYNDAILVTAVGSLPIRTGKQFESARKLGKTHQNVLVFVKGDPKKATKAVGPVECGDVESAPAAEAGARQEGAGVS